MRLPSPLPSGSGWMRICLLSPALAGARLALMRSMVARGVPPATSTPFQAMASKPASSFTPLSDSVGSSGVSE